MKEEAIVKARQIYLSFFPLSAPTRDSISHTNVLFCDRVDPVVASDSPLACSGG